MFSLAGFAQNSTLSPYSYYGIGQLNSIRSAENNAMGGITVYSDSTQFSFDNPATLSKLKFVQYRVGANYESVKQASTSTSSSTTISSLNYLALSVPTKYFAFSFGLRPKSSVGYRFKTTEVLDGVEQSLFFQGSGGVNSTFLGVSISPFQGLSIGVNAQYNFGMTEKNTTQNISGVQLGTQVLARSELSGIQYTYGMHYERSIFSKYILQLAATHSPAASIESTNSRSIYTVTSSGSIATAENIDLGNLAKTSSQLSSETTFGIGVGVSQKWFFGGTLLSSAKGIINPLDANPDINYVPTSRLSLGGFYIPKYDSFTSYFSRVAYRVGVRWEHTGLEVKNNAIKDSGITFGFGLPVGGFSKINFGVELGRLGTLEAGLVKEKYTNIMLGFSLSDIWFIKRKYD